MIIRLLTYEDAQYSINEYNNIYNIKINKYIN